MHHDKCSVGNASGGRNLLDHDKRERDCERSNGNIDREKSHLNVDYSARPMSASDAWEYACERAQECSPRKLRDNTIVMSMDVIHLPKNWSDVYPDRDPSEFFENVALPFCRDRWGGGEGNPNEISAVVHYDETRITGREGMPHLHYKSVPVTDEGRLSHKDIYNLRAMRDLHPSLSKFAEDRGYPGLDLYDQERSRAREQALSMPEYKEAQREIEEIRERLECLRQDERELVREIGGLQRSCDEALERCCDARDARIECQERVDGLERERGESEAQTEGLERERDEYETRVEGLEKERADVVGRIDSIESRIGEIRERVGEIRERVADICSQIRDRAEHALERLQERFQKVFSKVDDLEDRSERLQERSYETSDYREAYELRDEAHRLDRLAERAVGRMADEYVKLDDREAYRVNHGVFSRSWLENVGWIDQTRRDERHPSLDRDIADARFAAADQRDHHGQHDEWGRDDDRWEGSGIDRSEDYDEPSRDMDWFR